MGVLAGVLVLGVFLGSAFIEPKEGPRVLKDGTVALPPTLSEIVARCEGVHVLAPLQDGDEPSTGDVWSFLGVRGGEARPMSQYAPADSGVYFRSQEIDLESIRAAIADGAVVVWYSQDLPQGSFSAAARIVTDLSQQPQVDLLMVPIPATLKALNESSPILITQSGRYLSCQIPSVDVLEEFLTP